MPVDFDQVETVAAEVAGLYRDAEFALIGRITRSLQAGLGSPQWAETKLADVADLRKAAQLIMNTLAERGGTEIRAAVAGAYRSGRAHSLAELVARVAPGSDLARRARAASPFGGNSRAMEALADSIVSDLRPVYDRVTRESVDAYRSVVAAVTAQIHTGAATRRDAAQAAWSRLVDRGITSFTDTSGRKWRLSSYVEMATRTVTARAAVQGHVDTLTGLGLDLVQVSDVVQECKLCRPWEARILAVTGPAGRQRVPHQITGEPVTVDVAATLSEARRAGLHHPNCRHNISAYLPGVTRLPEPRPDPAGDAARQKQRELERRVRAAKGREVAALTPEAKAGARARLRGAQAALRDHLKEHPDLKRLPYREQPGAGNIPKVRLAGDEPHGLPADAETIPPPVDPLDGLDLTALSDDELAEQFSRVSELENVPDDVFERLSAEMERRENAVDDLPELTPEQKRIDDLIGKGWDYLDAYAEVYGKDIEQLRREERAALVERRAGETLDQAVRRAYDEWVHLQYLAAEDATRGHMLTAAGEAEGIDVVSLFSGPTARARKYASEDLQRWWADNGRMTYTEFKADILGRASDQAAAERTRLQGNGRDFI